jgi:type IV pilus assembly protein PilM
MSKFTLGIEITDDALKIVQMGIRKKKPYHFKEMIEKLPDQIVENGRVTNPDFIQKTIVRLLKQMKPKTRKAHMILPSQSVMVRFLKLPDLPINELRKVVDFEVKNNIHLPFDQPHYDFVKLAKHETPIQELKINNEFKMGLNEAAAASDDSSSLDMFNEFKDDTKQNPEQKQVDQKKLCDVMLVAAPYELIQDYVLMFKSAKLKLMSIEIKAFSLYRVVETFHVVPKDQTILIVDINRNVSDLSIFDKGQLKITRTVPLDFTPEEKSDEDNVELFSQFQQSSGGQFNNTCSDLSHELERLMNFYKYTLNNRSKDFDHIIVSGDVEKLTDIIEFLKNRMSPQVSLLNTNDQKIWIPAKTERIASLAVPIGLSLRGKQV